MDGICGDIADMLGLRIRINKFCNSYEPTIWALIDPRGLKCATFFITGLGNPKLNFDDIQYD